MLSKNYFKTSNGVKVLLFTLEYPPFHGGVANYYENLVKYWPAAGNIFVLNNNNGKLINLDLPWLKWLPAIIKLRQAVKNLKIDHVIVGHILPLGTVALICSGFCKIKYSVILHGLDSSYAAKSCRKRLMAKMVLAGAEKIICINSYTGELVKKFLPATKENKIVTVNPGVENLITHNAQLVTQLKIKYNLLNKFVLLSVGRLVKRKGFDKVIECLPEILKQTPNLIYIIVGGGEELNNYELRITNYKLRNNVIIINNASDEERNAWYDICDIFIMPAREINGDFEGFGIVYLEANLAGKPIIAGRSGGVGDAVIDGLNGLLVNPENINDIGQAIIRLAQNKDLRQRLGEQGKKRAINEFNWKKQIDKIYKAIT
jgi:phosphatidylinositol alpha-1,6-mannosyltransferase